MRKPEGRSGFLVVRKPPGMTSHDVVDIVRRRFSGARTGHAGTLDPLAEGVLVLGVGRDATRRLAKYAGADKEYEVVMVLGVSTDSQDAEGRVVATRGFQNVTEEDLRAVISRFTGKQDQIPPMFSAVKFEGRPLYKLARKGKVVQRAPRSIVVHSIEMRDFSPPEVRLAVRCSKGTYVRTLCADMGEELGCGAYVKNMVRTRVGDFSLRDSVTVEEMARMPREELESRLRPYENCQKS